LDTKYKKCFTHIHAITTLARMLTIRMRYVDWDRACETVTHNLERLVIKWRSAQHIGNTVLVLQDIARLTS
jgi:hypothetical protein